MPAEHFDGIYISHTEQMATSNFFFQPPVPHPPPILLSDLYPVALELVHMKLTWILNERTPI